MILFFRTISVFFIFFISAQGAFAQIRCATDEMHKTRMLKDTAYARQYTEFLKILNNTIAAKKVQAAKNMGAVSYPDTIYTIPVVVHIVHNNINGDIGGTNIPDEQVLSQIKVINQDYRRLNPDTSLTRAMFKPVAADSRIQFCLANRDPNGNFTSGITRSYSSQSLFDFGGSGETTLKAISYWPNDQYLNIWVAPLFYGASTLLGSTQLPEGTGLPGLTSQTTPNTLDGVCVDYRAFGTSGNLYNLYKKGRTATHEIGHYLGLFHTFENCNTDYCADTPTDRNPNADSDCLDSSDCSGPYTQDMTENYLDYSPDVCMNMFSKDQVLRMRTTIQVAPQRNSLLRSLGCCGDGMSEQFNTRFGEDFETNAFLSKGWTIQNPDTLVTWAQTSTAGEGNSSGSIFIKNDSVYSSSDPSKNKFYDLLVSPFINLSYFNYPVLEFDMAYAKNTLSITDSLVISYSILCDTVWTPLLNLYGSGLATTPVIQNMFVPSSTDWKHFKVKIYDLANKRFVRFRFENYSKGGNYLYLDNFNVLRQQHILIINLYPNPASDMINVETIINGGEKVHYQIYNILGQSIYSDEKTGIDTFTTSINTSDLAEGMYILKADIKEHTVFKRFIVKH
jgi:hypothetical protein